MVLPWGMFERVRVVKSLPINELLIKIIPAIIKNQENPVAQDY
jgi:hypothetical protein